jgi:hypothetical protein
MFYCAVSMYGNLSNTVESSSNQPGRSSNFVQCFEEQSTKLRSDRGSDRGSRRFPVYGFRFTVYCIGNCHSATSEGRGERGLTIILSYVRRSIAARSIVSMDFISCGEVSVDVDIA